MQQPREPVDDWQDKKFCCLIASNPEGLRTNLYLALNEYKKVDGYGLMFSNPVFSSKFEIMISIALGTLLLAPRIILRLRNINDSKYSEGGSSRFFIAKALRIFALNSSYYSCSFSVNAT